MEEVRKSYRQRFAEQPEEYRLLCQIVNLKPTRIVAMATTLLAYIGHALPEDKQEELMDIVRHGVLSKIADAKKMETARKETCCICGREFPSDGSGDVPICPPCLLNVPAPATAEAKP